MRLDRHRHGKRQTHATIAAGAPQISTSWGPAWVQIHASINTKGTPGDEIHESVTAALTWEELLQIVAHIMRCRYDAPGDGLSQLQQQLRNLSNQ